MIESSRIRGSALREEKSPSWTSRSETKLRAVQRPRGPEEPHVEIRANERRMRICFQIDLIQLPEHIKSALTMLTMLNGRLLPARMRRLTAAVPGSVRQVFAGCTCSSVAHWRHALMLSNRGWVEVTSDRGTAEAMGQ